MKGFFATLANGNFGYAKIYWSYYVLVSVVGKFLVSAVSAPETLMFFSLAAAKSGRQRLNYL